MPAPLVSEAIRPDFPILERRFNGNLMRYLDSASTSLKPNAVIDAEADYYRLYGANVFRGNHPLAEEASVAFDRAREQVASHIGADPLDVIFVANTTDAINLVATSLRLSKADRVLVPISEHHSNFLPWLRAASVETVPVSDEGFVDPDDVRRRLEKHTTLVALGHASNVTGAIQPVAEIANLCHERGAQLLVDGAQAAPHVPVDVKRLGCDYYAFSAHKMLGPTGIGALWGKSELLEALEPAKVGGGTVVRVWDHAYDLKALPHRLEAGTPHIAGAIGFGAAAAYLAKLGMEAVAQYEEKLTHRLLERLRSLSGVKILGSDNPHHRLCVVSMAFAQASPDRVANDLANQHAIMVRQGQHCAQPLLHHFSCVSALRASGYIYTTLDEVDCFVDALDAALRTKALR